MRALPRSCDQRPPASLFRRAGEVVDELEAAPGPWFLTLLTVGTHHPYTLPPDVERSQDDDGLRSAFETLDASASDFFDSLARRGVLDDTLVLLTVDESPAVTTVVCD